MRKLVLLFSIFFSGYSWSVAEIYSGDLVANQACTESVGTWVHLYDGNAMILYGGTFGSGTATLWTRWHDRVTEQTVPSSAQTAATTFPVGLGGGAEVCIALSGASSPAFHWEINPLYVKDPNSGNLINRYFSTDYN